MTPLAHDYHGYTVHEIPPNGQGIAALMALGILENFDLRGYAVDSIEVQHLEIEAMKLAFADAYRYVADPRAMTVTPAQLLDRGYLASRARLIDRSRAQDFRHGTAAAGGDGLPHRRRRGRHDGVARSSRITWDSDPASWSRAPASACRTAAPAFRWRTATRISSAAASVRFTPSFRVLSRGTDNPTAASASWAVPSSRRRICRRW